MGIIESQIKDILHKGIVSFSNPKGEPVNDYQLLIYTDNDEATPKYKKLHNFKPIEQIQFLDFAPKEIKFLGIPINIEEKAPGYLSKALKKLASKNECEAKDVQVMIFTDEKGEETKICLYINYVEKGLIPIDYFIED